MFSKYLVIMQNFMFLKKKSGFGSEETPIPGVTKLRYFLTRCPALYSSLVGWANVQNHYCKRTKNGPVAAFKKDSFVTPRME